MKTLMKALLLLSVATMAAGATARADDRYWNNVNTGVRVNANAQAPRLPFSHSPQWVQVSGTSVFMVRDEERPDFDMFRYGSDYYIYDGGNWFLADRWNGNYQWLDDRSIPSALARVPEAEWRHYPNAWANGGNWDSRYSNTSTNTSRTYQQRSVNTPDPRMDFRVAPSWRLAPGTQVYLVTNPGSTSYDLFRVGSNFYLYGDNGNWYRSNAWNGRYDWVDARNVPMAIADVPARMWQHYPSEWANRDPRMDNRYDRSMQDHRSARDLRTRLDYRNAPPAPRVAVGTMPNWRMIANSPVYVSSNTNANYDLFRVGNTYYLYNNGYWYRSNRWNGTFMSTDQARLPRELMRVPGNQWRHGPPAWANSRSYR